MDMPHDAKQIPGSKDYVDRSGNIYSYVTSYSKGKIRTTVVKKSRHIKKGLAYCSVADDRTQKSISRGVHVVVAETFLVNPNTKQYKFVNHRNGIGTDNRVENLYWAKNIQENVSKKHTAVSILMFKTNTNELLNTFDTIEDAAEKTKIPINIISRQVKYHRPVRKEYYFRYEDDETVQPSISKCEQTIESKSE